MPRSARTWLSAEVDRKVHFGRLRETACGATEPITVARSPPATDSSNAARSSGSTTVIASVPP